jgi:predicted MFS family arabinose efflux permease
MTLGRTILHNQVPDNMRSRAASVYQLCLYGGAPLGALVCGLLVEWIGLSYAFFAIALATSDPVGDNCNAFATVAY